MVRLSFVSILLLIPCRAATGQEPGAADASRLDALVAEIVRLKSEPGLDKTAKASEQVAFASKNSRVFLDYCVNVRSGLDFAHAEESRTDKQVGSTAGSSGSTNLASKAGSPAFFGLAVENGAFTRTVDGTTVTFRANLVGLTDMLMTKGYLQGFDDDSPTTRFLRRLSVAVSLDTSRDSVETAGNGSSGGGVADTIRNQIRLARQRLSSYSVRMDLWNRRDPRDVSNQALVQGFSNQQMQSLLKALEDVFARLQEEAPGPDNMNRYEKWTESTVKELLDPDAGAKEVRSILVRRMGELRDLAREVVPQFDAQVEKAQEAYTRYFDGRAQLLKEVEKKPMASLEYVNTRQINLPDYTTIRFVSETNLRRTRMDVTANAAISFLNEKVPGAAQMRDWQFSLQGDLPLGRRAGGRSRPTPLGNMVLTFAFLAQYLRENAPIEFGGAKLQAEKGTIAIGQAKLTIPIKNSGLKIPLSLTYANRTELILEKELRGNIGITFDFDSIAALLKK